MSELPLEEVADVEAAASRCAGKVLQEHGVPMVLALEDVTSGADADGPGPAGPAGGTEAYGRVLADRLAAYRAVLSPAAPGDAYWPVHDALVVVADAHGPDAARR